MATATVKPTVQIGDEVRAMNDAEFAQYELDQAESKIVAKALSDKAIARRVVLDRLGITTDEAALLLG